MLNGSMRGSETALGPRFPASSRRLLAQECPERQLVAMTTLEAEAFFLESASGLHQLKTWVSRLHKPSKTDHSLEVRPGYEAKLPMPREDER